MGKEETAVHGGKDLSVIALQRKAGCNPSNIVCPEKSRLAKVYM